MNMFERMILSLLMLREVGEYFADPWDLLRHAGSQVYDQAIMAQYMRGLRDFMQAEGCSPICPLNKLAHFGEYIVPIHAPDQYVERIWITHSAFSRPPRSGLEADPYVTFTPRWPIYSIYLGGYPPFLEAGGGHDYLLLRHKHNIEVLSKRGCTKTESGIISIAQNDLSTVEMALSVCCNALQQGQAAALAEFDNELQPLYKLVVCSVQSMLAFPGSASLIQRVAGEISHRETMDDRGTLHG